ncbi:MAG: adenylosuccinate lyase [Deltaproteobacteria bacterium]|nr:adenylosuccinate lyase [Deltaproteobacteria bacterium]MBI4373434.1 adenylosuccinate lyase [Deltaproteobacteria bacterium]
MIPRYSRSQMAKIWEPENKFKLWLEIELLACEGWEQLGRIPRGTAAQIRKKAKFDIARIDEIEKKVQHDVIAFLTNVGESVGPDARWLHFGMTSSDLLDTCFSLQLRQAADLVVDDLKGLLKVLKRRAFEFKEIPMIGRTHGIHAEPITFGLKLASWHEEIQRHLLWVEASREEISVGKISGAVGTYAHLEPKVELYVCEKSGLTPDPVSTQIVSRDRYANFFSRLALLASSMERMATEIRHLQRTEVLEAEEFFAEGQKGSSAMPHKRNPVLSENICGLARLVRSAVIPSLENVTLWHERDISHSSVERILAPESTILIDFMLARFTKILDQLLVYPKNMKKNLEKTGKLIFSEGVLLKLIETGLSREGAYKLVQKQAMRSWKEGADFEEAVRKDTEISKRMSKKDFEQVFDLGHVLRHVETIFKRVFNTPSS